MTALMPSPDSRVKGVASVRYPLNKTCAMPTCSEPVNSAHHCYPRSQIGNGSWFVLLDPGVKGKREGIDSAGTLITSSAIPHVIGLCGSGTTGHHGDLEEHRAWVKLEDGEFVWYDRDGDDWTKVGALNPQPGSREGKPKRKKYQGEQRRQRKTISIKVPQDAQEDGGAIWDELMEQARAILGAPDKPAYYVLTAALYVFIRDEGGRA